MSLFTLNNLFKKTVTNECVACGVEIHNRVCNECGFVKKQIEIKTTYSNELSSYSTRVLKFVGNDYSVIRIYNKRLTTNHYKNNEKLSKYIHRKKVMKELENYNSRFDTNPIPIHLLDPIASMYIEKQSSSVKRGNNRIATFAIYTSLILDREGLSRPMCEIADFFDISTKDITAANKNIHRFKLTDNFGCEKKNFKDELTSLTYNYVKRYLLQLDISNIYLDCIVAIITSRFISFGKRTSNNYTLDTKCAGVIYLFVQIYNLRCTENNISDKCNVTKTTFKKFYKYIVKDWKKKILKKIKKHNLPIKWIDSEKN